MDTFTPAVTPLRQRMLEDMRLRKLEPRTQEAYIRAVRKLGAYLRRSPDTATVKDLRNFQLHLVDTGASPMTLNVTLTGLRFLFDVTLERVDLMARMHPVKLPHKMPVVLSPQETARLIAAATTVKHQAALSVAYGAGLRAGEVIGLKVTDVDSQPHPVPRIRGEIALQCHPCHRSRQQRTTGEIFGVRDVVSAG
jgi:site-specific recombinase XerD